MDGWGGAGSADCAPPRSSVPCVLDRFTGNDSMSSVRQPESRLQAESRMVKRTEPFPGWPRGVWTVWALAVVPAMFILPLYALPLEVGSRGISAFNGRRLIKII